MTPRLHTILSRIAAPKVARDMGRRWGGAQRAAPGLAADIAHLGGVFIPAGAPPDPQRLAYDAGRRDLALEVLALMGLTPDEINQLAAME